MRPLAGAEVLRQAVLRPARGGTAHPRSRRALPAPRYGRAGSRGFLHRNAHLGNALFDGQGDAPRDTGVVDWNFLCTAWSWMDMAVGERAQEGAERGGGTDTAEQSRHRTVPQEVEVVGGVDAVCACGHAAHDAGDLRVRRRTRAVPHLGQLALLRHQSRQTTLLDRPHHRDQPGLRDQIRVIERSGDRRRRMGNLHLGSALPIARA
ncbi:phosphotransferase [Streptomyces celluloflavus]|uniref:phosphotransferase n=1 Tax=Streptomyces celluloflavus TaxID=58344 RepID=UPI003689EBA2